MKWQMAIAIAVVFGAAAGTTLAQDDENRPPQVLDETVVWRYCPGTEVEFLNLFDFFFANFFFGECPFFFFSWDPGLEARQGLYTIAAPGDAIQVTFDIFDADWLPDPNELEPGEIPELEEEDIYYCVDAFITFGGATGLIGGLPNVAINVPEDCVFIRQAPSNPLDPRVTVNITIPAPDLLGPTIDRLIGDDRGTAPDYDVLMDIFIFITNNADGSGTGDFVQYFDPRDPNDPNQSLITDPNNLIGPRTPTLATRFSLTSTSNGPPFADAGPDQVVVPGTTLTLVARDTFDGFNVGFDVDAPLTFAEDEITYAWQWINGPTEITPIQITNDDPLATVTVPPTLLNNDPGGTDEYTFRVTVSDNFNQLSTADTVKVTVQNQIENLPPLLVLERVSPLSSAVQLNETVILSAAASLDLNTPAFPEELSYFWTQVDELGVPLTTADATTLLLPLNGVDTHTISFQALRLGEFFFRVTISDGELFATDTIGIVVTDQAVMASGRQTLISRLITTPGDLVNANTGRTEREPTDGTPVSESDPPTPVTGPAGLCGFGLMMPLLAVPIGLWTLRRRR